MFALVASLSGAWAQDVNLCAEEGVTAKIGEASWPNFLTSAGAQPNSYDANDEMNIVVDLQATKTIDGFALTFSGDRWVSEFTLSYSTDGESYTKIGDIATGRTAQNPETNLSQAFGSSIEARYVKYTSKKSNKNVTDQWSETIKNFQLIQYATGSNVPPTHDDVFDPVYTSAHTNAHWAYGYNGGATIGAEATYGGMPVTPFSAVKCIFFGTTAWNGSFNVVEMQYKELCLDIYTTETSDNYIIKLEGATTTDRPISLTTTGWNTVKIDITDETTISNVSLRHKDGASASAGVLDLSLANIYYTKAEEEAPSLYSLSVSPGIVGAGTPTAITVSAYDKTSKIYNDVDYTLDGVAETFSSAVTLTAGTHTIVATDRNDGSIQITKYIYAVDNIPEAKSGSNNLEIYTSSTSATWSPAGTEVTISEQKAMFVQVASSVTMTPSTSGPLKNYNRISVAVFPNKNFSGAVVVNPDNKFLNYDFTGGEWNVIDFEYSSENEANITEMHINASNVEMLIANAVVYYHDPDAFNITTSNGVATVTGNVAAGNIPTIEAADAMVIDLTGVLSISNTFTPNHKNAIICLEKLPGDGDISEGIPSTFSSLSSMKNLVYICNNNYFKPYAQLDFTDENGEPFWNGEGTPVPFLSTNAQAIGYKITRSIPAGKYVTAAPMTSVTAPENIDVYEFTGYTTGVVTFTKKDNRNLSTKTPYVLYNTTGSPIDLEVVGTGEFNPSTGAVTVTNDGASFVANLTELTTSGSQYVLSNGTIYQGNGMKVGAYRAYFTGVGGAVGARAAFLDGETTKIGVISANGEMEVGEFYNLRGQRVQNPTKGLYIVNGKKVVIK